MTSLKSHYLILNKHTIVDLFCSKWISHRTNQQQYICMYNLRPKLKKIVCFPHPTDRQKTLQLEIFFCMICDDFYFLLVTGNRDRKFRYCSRIYVRNWFTLLNEQNPLFDFEGSRFVNERSLFSKKKKNPLPTDPQVKWRVRCGKRTYF